MDVNALRSITTMLMFVVFLGIVLWAWNSRRRADFDEAAQLPFVDGPLDSGPAAAPQGEKQ